VCEKSASTVWRYLTSTFAPVPMNWGVCVCVSVCVSVCVCVWACVYLRAYLQTYTQNLSEPNLQTYTQNLSEPTYSNIQTYTLLPTNKYLHTYTTYKPTHLQPYHPMLPPYTSLRLLVYKPYLTSNLFAMKMWNEIVFVCLKCKPPVQDDEDP